MFLQLKNWRAAGPLRCWQEYISVAAIMLLIISKIPSKSYVITANIFLPCRTDFVAFWHARCRHGLCAGNNHPNHGGELFDNSAVFFFWGIHGATPLCKHQACDGARHKFWFVNAGVF